MKQIIYSLFIVSLVFGCTSYDNDIKINVQDYKIVTPENIDTNLKVANLILNETEFEEMYTNFYEDIEIEGVLNLYKNGVTLIENEIVEVEVKGNFSAAFELKSLGIKFDDTYHNQDRKLIDPETILPFHSLDRIKAFRFRNSGNDFENTMLKDMSYTKLAIDAGLNLDLTYVEQSVVFVNSKFLGVMNIRTEANTNGISRLYGVSKSDITLARVEIGIVEKKDGDFDRIDNFIAAIENDDYASVSNEIDVDNFIDYMIFESYIGNRDWPNNNVRFFAINDGPFRFVLYDLDLVSTEDIDRSPMSFINQSVNKNPITDLFKIMYANNVFKQMYDARFQHLMNSTLLSSARFNTIVTEYKKNIEHIMPTQINKYSTPKTFTEWYLNIEHLKNNFEAREGYVW